MCGNSGDIIGEKNSSDVRIYQIRINQIIVGMDEASRIQLSKDKGSKIVVQPNPTINLQYLKLHKATFGRRQKYIKMFDLPHLFPDLSQTLKYNQSLLTSVSEFPYPNHLLDIELVQTTPNGFFFVTDRFQYRLNQYLNSNLVAEKEALRIFEQVLKAVYSLTQAGSQCYTHENLRAEHFVMSKGYWKLESLIYDFQDPLTVSSKHPASEYLPNKDYFPPECLLNPERPSSDTEKINRMVWSLGCILITILTGSHRLKSLEIMNKFKGQPFALEKIIKAEISLSEGLKEMLGKMCHYDVKKRMKLKQLFQCGFFSQDVSERVRKRGWNCDNSDDAYKIEEIHLKTENEEYPEDHGKILTPRYINIPSASSREQNTIRGEGKGEGKGDADDDRSSISIHLEGNQDRDNFPNQPGVAKIDSPITSGVQGISSYTFGNNDSHNSIKNHKESSPGNGNEFTTPIRQLYNNQDHQNIPEKKTILGSYNPQTPHKTQRKKLEDHNEEPENEKQQGSQDRPNAKISTGGRPSLKLASQSEKNKAIFEIAKTHLVKCEEMILSDGVLSIFQKVMHENNKARKESNLNYKSSLSIEKERASLVVLSYRLFANLLSLIYLHAIQSGSFYSKILSKFQDEESNGMFSQKDLEKFYNNSHFYRKFQTMRTQQKIAKIKSLKNTIEAIRAEMNQSQVYSLEKTPLERALTEILTKISKTIMEKAKEIQGDPFEEPFIPYSLIQYKDFKETYKEIIFLFYSISEKQYLDPTSIALGEEKNASLAYLDGEKNRSLLWARITTKVCYCFAIDKIYRAEQTYQNLATIWDIYRKRFPQSESSVSAWLIDSEVIQYFFEEMRDRQVLVKFSNFIIKSFYNLK